MSFRAAKGSRLILTEDACGTGMAKAWTVVTEEKSVIDLPMDGAPSEGCSTTTNLAQLSIEPDAVAGAVHIIILAKNRRFPSRFASAMSALIH